MNKVINISLLLLISLLFTACFGYSGVNNEAVGQVKKVEFNTPIICPNFYDVDVTLGVLKNGTGSMSTEDIWLYIPDNRLVDKLKVAQESGKLVKLHYNIARVTYCVESYELIDVEVM